MIRGLKPGVVLIIPVTVIGVAPASRPGARNETNFAVTAAPDAASLFNSQCVTCHGRDGRGKTKRGRQMHSRDISNAEWQNDVSDERIFNSISRGKGKMPSFKKLSDAQIDSLVTYVRQLRK
ncbi:MAG TPA: cytochrome c [Pyrinomonadaceae bacterium]|nr:cytochrome c [Pyrinomonadaceae bacterium]